MQIIFDFLGKVMTYLTTAPKWAQAFVLAGMMAIGWLAFAKWAELPPFTAGTTRVSIGELIQYQQTMAHADETPSVDQTFHDDARGKTRVRLYDSDLALQVIRAAPGSRTISVWIPLPAPDKIAYYHHDDGSEITYFGLASPAFAGGQPVGYYEMVAHGQPDKQWKEPTKEPGVWLVWLWWRDDCTGYFVFYESSNSFLLDANGNPAFFWQRHHGN